MHLPASLARARKLHLLSSEEHGSVCKRSQSPAFSRGIKKQIHQSLCSSTEELILSAADTGARVLFAGHCRNVQMKGSNHLEGIAGQSRTCVRRGEVCRQATFRELDRRRVPTPLDDGGSSEVKTCSVDWQAAAEIWYGELRGKPQLCTWSSRHEGLRFVKDEGLSAFCQELSDGAELLL